MHPLHPSPVPHRSIGLQYADDAQLLATCSSSSTSTIVNPAGASALAACKTYSGDIMIAAGAASNQGTVNLDGVKEIIGALSYQDDNQVTAIEAGDLQSVGNLFLGNLTALSSLKMPALGSVADMNFTGLGALASLGFGVPGIRTAGNVLIINTVLTDLKGLTGLTSVTGVSISNNPYLATIELDVTSIGSTGGDATGAIDIGANDVSSGGQTINFPKLATASQITIRNASNIELPVLANVSQNLGFYGNLVKNIALPNLTFAGGIVIVDNTQLTNISMPMLTTINGTNGTYQIANNTMLKAIDGFEDLSTVTGGLDFTGNFTEYVFSKNIFLSLSVTNRNQCQASPIEKRWWCYERSDIGPIQLRSHQRPLGQPSCQGCRHMRW